jgi:hypothetical protein
MISLKEYIDEAKGGIRFVLNGIKVIDTNHAVERAEERQTGRIDLIDDMLRRIVWFFRSGREKEGHEEYMFTSKKYNQSVVVAWRQEREWYDSDGKKHVIVQTVLPVGKHIPKKGTPKFMMENCTKVEVHEQHLMNKDEIALIEMLDLPVNVLNESVIDGDYSTYDICEGLKLIMVDGKAYNFAGDIAVVDLDAFDD